jgi:bleomycin hydrolase
MRTKIITLLFLIFPFFPAYSQENTLQRIEGSWMGKVTTDNFSLRLLFKFEYSGNRIKGSLDSPDQGIKDIPFDKVWMVNDSIFTDATRSMHAGIVFKGNLLAGDSVIDGTWGGALKLRLSRTDFVFTLRTNNDPQVEGYKIIKLINSTPIKDQQATGYCWSFATTSFIETEAIRMGKNPVVLSPIFYVCPTYTEKAVKYVRMNGKSYFNEGDLTFSALGAYRKFGAIPESVYPGKRNPTDRYNSTEMSDSLQQRIKYYTESGRGNFTIEGVRKDITGIVTNTFGKAPDQFTYQGKIYTPLTFAKEMVGINPDNYVEITSFTHHPFFSKCILEIESNWNNNNYLNLPLNEFAEVIEYALMHDFSVGWDGDIYEGYNDGFAILNDTILNVTQQERQEAFDNHTTEDVHNMHIIGIAENEKGRRFYIVKNSSDSKNCGGYLYMSKEYLLKKTISVLVNKDAVPKEIKERLGFIL